MKLEIKTNDGSYVAKLESFGFTGSVCFVYKVSDCKFLWIKYKSENLISQSVSAGSYQDAILRGPSWLESEARGMISRYEHARDEWSRAGVEL